MTTYCTYFFGTFALYEKQGVINMYSRNQACVAHKLPTENAISCGRGSRFLHSHGFICSYLHGNVFCGRSCLYIVKKLFALRSFHVENLSIIRFLDLYIVFLSYKMEDGVIGFCFYMEIFRNVIYV